MPTFGAAVPMSPPPRQGPSWRVRSSCALAAAATLVLSCAPAAVRDDFDPDLVPDAYLGAGAALAHPGAARAWWVAPDGSLYNGDWQVRIEAWAGDEPAASPRRVAAEDRWLPVLHWKRASGSVTWRFELAAAPSATRDSGFIASLRVRAHHAGGSPANARLRLTLAAPDSAPPFVAFDAAEPAPEWRWGSGGGDALVHGWSDEAGPVSGPALERTWTIAPGASEEARIVLPVYPERERDLAAWSRVPHVRRAAESRRDWTARLERGTRFELGDPEIEHALSGALVVLHSCRERRGDAEVPIGSPLHYRDVWLRDGARTIEALSVSGHGDAARALASGLLRLQLRHGPFLSQRGQLDGTGQALWALEQAHLRPPPGRAASDSGLARAVAAAERAWRWGEWQRGLGREAGWPHATLMPWSEPRDNELVAAQLVGNDAWMIAGYRAAERLFRAAGREADAVRIAATFDAYRADFLAALERSGPDVPASWQGVGRDWGNLIVGAPGHLLPASDPRLEALANRVWDRWGGPGLLGYGGPDTLQYYYGVDLAVWALLAGRRDDADRVLDAMLHWRTASGGAGELFSRAGAVGANLPPHGTSAAALVSLVRHALVHDATDTLRLTLGAREGWWRGARVRRAPTRWGTLDLRFERSAAEARWRWTAVPVPTALTLPPGTRLAAPPPPPLAPGPMPTIVLAPPGTSSARVTLAPEAGGGS